MGVNSPGGFLMAMANPCRMRFWKSGKPARPRLVTAIKNQVREARNSPGFGRIATNEGGEFQFNTVRPAPRRGEDGLLHAPHLAVVVLMRGLLRHLLTRVYFAGEATNREDAVLNLVPPERQQTLLAKPANERASELSWDIHLQGELETVFFEA